MSNLDRITKVSFKDGGVHVTTETDEGSRQKNTQIKDSRTPHPDFTAAMAGLEEYIRDILGIGSVPWKNAITVTGVSYSRSEGTGVEGAVVTFQVSLEERCYSPFCGNTPHLPFEQYTEDGNAPLMPDYAVEQVALVRNEALAYVNGKGAQGDLFADGKSAAAGDGREEPTPIGELADEVVDEVVDEVERIGKAHGMSDSIINAAREDLAKEGNKIESKAKPKGERTGKSNVVRIKDGDAWPKGGPSPLEA